MPSNRRHAADTVRLGPAVKAFLLCLLLGGAAIGYVAQKNQIHQLGQAQRQLEIQLEQLRRDNRIRAGQVADLHLPHRLQERVKEQKLDLTPVQPHQVVRLVESVAMTSAAITNRAP